MPKNLTGQQAGLAPGDQVNDPSVRVIKGKNLFPQSFRHPSTCRYGEVDVLAAMRCERGDTFPYKFVTDLDTYTLQSPIKSEVSMYTAAFKVPMEAIYPRNWRDRMYPNPLKGDDVPDDTRALFNVMFFLQRLTQSFNGYKTASNLDGCARTILLMETLFSAGSLFSKFNMHLNSFSFQTSNSNQESFDKFFDTQFAPFLKSKLVWDTEISTSYPAYIRAIDSSDDSYSYVVVPDGSDFLNFPEVTLHFITFRRALEMLRTGDYYIDTDSWDGQDFPMFPVINYGNSALNDALLNIEPIIAYKLVSNHFFVNSKVDFVYTAQLFRDNQESLVFGQNTRPTFLYNGTTCQYDVFSQNVLTHASLALMPDSFGLANVVNYSMILGFWFNLFSWTRSLRYGDYFTGSHVEPLAVGDINAPVTDGSVNAIDITKKLQLTRFLNKINIVGQRFEDYIRALFGGAIPEAPADVPVRLSLEKSSLSGFEVNNTGSEQASSDARNIITTNLKASESKYLFEAEIDQPCWIIVTRHFDVERIYSKTCDRFAFHYDRFDDFIPDMQFIGDQDVKSCEIDITRADTPFSYNLRYMEYKNRYSYASGGFIEYLPSWAFITDNRDGALPGASLSPSYIRSSPSEFDRFYKSFADCYSLASYFHFITFTTNVVNPYRQMVFAPEILA